MLPPGEVSLAQVERPGWSQVRPLLAPQGRGREPVAYRRAREKPGVDGSLVGSFLLLFRVSLWSLHCSGHVIFSFRSSLQSCFFISRLPAVSPPFSSLQLAPP